LNGAGAGGFPAVWDQEFDEAMAEGVFGSSFSMELGSGLAGWQQVVADALETGGYGRRRNAFIISANSYYYAAQTIVTQPQHKDALHGLCTALLVDAGFMYYMRINGTAVEATSRYRHYIAEYDIALGTPVEPVIDPDAHWLATGSTKVWRREFQGGYVFVNPKQIAGNAGNWDAVAYRASFTLPFDVRRPPGCLDPNGDASLGGADGETITAGTTITMHARSGLILLKV
jgi:hypothetical protein